MFKKESEFISRLLSTSSTRTFKSLHHLQIYCSHTQVNKILYLQDLMMCNDCAIFSLGLFPMDFWEITSCHTQNHNVWRCFYCHVYLQPHVSGLGFISLNVRSRVAKMDMIKIWAKYYKPWRNVSLKLGLMNQELMHCLLLNVTNSVEPKGLIYSRRRVAMYVESKPNKAKSWRFWV